MRQPAHGVLDFWGYAIMSHKRKIVPQAPYHVTIVDEMNLIGKDTECGFARAYGIARLIRRTACPKDAKTALEAFNAMLKRIGGIKNNVGLTTAQRSELYGAKAALKAQCNKDVEKQLATWKGDGQPAQQQAATA